MVYLMCHVISYNLKYVSNQPNKNRIYSSTLIMKENKGDRKIYNQTFWQTDWRIGFDELKSEPEQHKYA